MSIRALSLLAVFGLAAADARAASRPHYDAALVAREAGAARPGALAMPPAIVHASDPGRGVPSLLWSADPRSLPRAGLSPVEAARAHLVAHRERYGVTEEVIAGARALFTHDTGRGGVIVGFRQQVGDVEVVHGDIKVLLDRTGRLVAIAGSPHPSALPAAARSFAGSEAGAVARAVGDLYLRSLSPAQFVAGARRAEARDYALAPVSTPERGELRFRAPARVKPVYFPLGDSLVPAYSVELKSHLTATSRLDVYRYVIAADSGAVLLRADLTASDAFGYFVWADADGDLRPADGPLEDFTPHPTGSPDIGPQEAIKQVLVTVEGLNHNPDGKADPWLPAGAVETVGNHVDAYVDHSDPNGLQPEDGEFRAKVTAPGVFAYDFDVGAEPLSSAGQSQAALVHMFYVLNWLHDWWYDSGFVEATGVAQADNFGRGGVEGDPLRAEGQDAALEGALNNANMATPADGSSPVMQMYLWSPRLNEGTLTILPGDVVYAVAKAQFGPLAFDLQAPLVLLDDGAGVDPNDGCEAATKDLTGAIALVDRGNCSFEAKTATAQAAGAVGVIIANHQADGLPPLGNDNETEDPTIPVLGLSLADGDALKGMIGNDITAHMVGTTDVMRDGTVDSMIIAHEYGHYLHHRLEDCGNAACRAMSEGWGDFNSLMMMLREGDPLDGVYAGVTYAGFDPHGYFGIRRVPYSVDTSKNALSFRHVADGEALPASHPIQSNGIANSEVHNAGEVWATMVWEAYIALHQAHQGDMTFAEVHRLMTDYLVAGMLMTPHDATFTEQRDAILLAIAAASADDFFTVAEAFARRGAGSCAVSPPADSVDFVGVKEDFELRANGTLTGFTFDDGAASCDGDGVLDGGEEGRIHVELANGGAKPLPAGSVVEVLSPTATLVFPKGSAAELGALAALETTSLDFAVALVKGVEVDEHVTVAVRVTTPEGCSSVKELELPVALNADVLPQAAASDDVETPESADVWKIAGVGGTSVWRREPIGDGHAWRGADLGRVTDATLASPTLQVAADGPFVVAFDHAYQFEFSDGTNWDGGVVELSTDAGATWQDVAELTAIPYGGAIMSQLNPINGRMAFVNTNPSYPGRDRVTLDFGAKLAGKSVTLRFRVATDSAAGAAGWTIDDIAIEGIENTPFPVWVPDQAQCAGEATTSAGEDSGSSGSSGEDDAATAGGALDDDGCGCRGERSGAPALLGLAALARRRRRRRK